MESAFIPSSVTLVRGPAPRHHYSSRSLRRPLVVGPARRARPLIRACTAAADDDADTPPPSSPPSTPSSSDYLSALNRASEKRQSSPSSSDDDDAPVTVLGTTIPSKSAPPPPPATTPNPDPTYDYSAAARCLSRVGWVVWWPHFILTLVAAVIILFAFAFPPVSVSATASTIGLALVSGAIVISLLSAGLTLSYTRLAAFLVSPATSRSLSLRARIQARLRTGFVVAMIGLAVAATGLQALAGTILSKLLTGRGGAVKPPPGTVPNNAVWGAAVDVVQPVDILVVQACANVTLAFVVALAATAFFMARLPAWERRAKLEKDKSQQPLPQ